MMISRTHALLTNAAIITVLTLSACTSTQTSSQPKTTLPAHNVVLMDPSIDDHSLPALGEGLSKGAVTIYSLEGPNAILPIDVVGAGSQSTGPQPILTPAPIHPAPVSSQQMSAPLTIQAPANMKRGNADPRVSVFNPDTGIKTTEGKSTSRAPATDPTLRPPLLPPPLSDKTQPLKSPFTGTGALAPDVQKDTGSAARPAPARDTTTWNPPTSNAGSNAGRNAPVASTWIAPIAATGSDRRAVMSEDLMPSDLKPSRPPKGMTY